MTNLKYVAMPCFREGYFPIWLTPLEEGKQIELTVSPFRKPSLDQENLLEPSFPFHRRNRSLSVSIHSTMRVQQMSVVDTGCISDIVDATVYRGMAWRGGYRLLQRWFYILDTCQTKDRPGARGEEHR